MRTMPKSPRALHLFKVAARQQLRLEQLEHGQRGAVHGLPAFAKERVPDPHSSVKRQRVCKLAGAGATLTARSDSMTTMAFYTHCCHVPLRRVHGWVHPETQQMCGNSWQCAINKACRAYQTLHSVKETWL